MNYKAKDIETWIKKYEQYFQLVMVAHTNFYPKDKSNISIEMNQYKRCHFLKESLKRTNIKMYPLSPQLPKNNPKYRLYTFNTVEFNSPYCLKNETMHMNTLIGNIPAYFSKDQFLDIFLSFWHKEFKQSKDVWIKTVDELKTEQSAKEQPISIFCNYNLKDAYKDNSKAWKVNGTWDVQNLNLPTDIKLN